MKALLSAALVLTAVALAGCTVHQTPAPGLTGPSDLALSMHVTALPDSISQDGGSQSQIQISAFGPDGKPKVGLALRVDMFVNDATGHLVGADYGTLSARTVVTNTNGVAMVIYTAPPNPVAGIFGTCQGLPGNCVLIVATALGTDFEAATPQSVTIRLVPPGAILPPASIPTALFTFSPATPAANAPVAFDASASCAGPAGSTGGCLASNNVLTGFSWMFGDGQTGSGRTLSHSYASAGTYNVTLTVTNDRGITGFLVKPVTVGAGAGPTAAFIFSPTPVVVNVQTFFDASASTGAAGHTIASYTWNWGDGAPVETRGSATNSHIFTATGTYLVLLTVADESGQKGTTTQSVVVIAGNPQPVITFSPSTGIHPVVIAFNSTGSTTTSGASIATYAWDFGDPLSGSNTSALANPTHQFNTAGTFTVRLTITDSLGRVGTITITVTIT
jgi:PKD repeat protein